MRKYNFATGEFEEEEVICYGCGNPIDMNNGISSGIKICYIENENKERIKVSYGSCCAGKINVYKSISKKVREAYRNNGQISDEVLAKMPLAPKPIANSCDAGREVHNFVDKIGRSKLSNSNQAKIKYKRSKGLKS
jgi:hypothetical protein